VDAEKLNAVNAVPDVMLATRKGATAVKAGDKLAGMRVIPLVVPETTLDAAAAAAGSTPILNVLPYKLKTAGIVTTGSEVKKGLIEDKFTPVVKKKLEGVGIETVAQVFSGDGVENVAIAINQIRAKSVDLVLCTGGMSVDPDDNTPGGIRAAGAEIVTYGAPVLPGAMFMLGYFSDGTPVMGLPGCVMFAGATVFDLVLPAVAAGIPVSRSDIVALGNGGLCLGCKPCHWPNCPFGK
jgi:molybdopterin biosynthesis enzyme